MNVKLEDSFRTKGMRKMLVDKLRHEGLSDTRVLDAINHIPRHWFIESCFMNFAYEDKAFQIGENQTISHPSTVATQTQLLSVHPSDKILEIGTGSGYQTCVLLEMGATVYTIERQRVLYNKAKALLSQMGYFPKFFFGDGYLGLPNFAPFDKILITCGAPFIPEALKEQLKVGGRMVIPVGENVQEMTVVDKVTEDTFEIQTCGEFRFVPMLEDRTR